MRRALLATIAVLSACGTDATAPKPDNRIVGPPGGEFVNQGFTAIAVSFQNGQALFAQVQTVKKATNGSPIGTSLHFQRTSQQDGTVLEDFTAEIPTTDFTGGSRNGAWALHSDISGHGVVDLAWVNTGHWERQLPFTAPIPGTTGALKFAGAFVLQGPAAGNVTGSIFGQTIGLDPAHGDAFGTLSLNANVVVVLQQR